MYKNAYVNDLKNCWHRASADILLRKKGSTITNKYKKRCSVSRVITMINLHNTYLELFPLTIFWKTLWIIFYKPLNLAELSHGAIWFWLFSLLEDFKLFIVNSVSNLFTHSLSFWLNFGMSSFSRANLFPLVYLFHLCHHS